MQFGTSSPAKHKTRAYNIFCSSVVFFIIIIIIKLKIEVFLCFAVFFFVIRAHFVIGFWAIKLHVIT
jgi:hypothetical protein